MKPTTLIAGLVLVAGLAAAAWKLNSSTEAPLPAAAAGPGAGETAALEDRLAALELAVAEERQARQLLEEELVGLYAELDALGSGGAEATQRREGDEQAVPREVQAGPGRPRSRGESAEQRAADLVEAGFAPDRAEWILRRESELQVAAMQARFDAARSGEQPTPFDPAVNPELALRGEIGDAEYERYLEASGRPTSVAVRNVLESSAGQSAGLQPGDEIVRYDGERVFSTFDLYRQTMQGEAGESVVVDIERDGVPMQVVLPRGPLGITSRGWRRGP